MVAPNGRNGGGGDWICSGKSSEFLFQRLEERTITEIRKQKVRVGEPEIPAADCGNYCGSGCGGGGILSSTSSKEEEIPILVKEEAIEEAVTGNDVTTILNGSSSSSSSAVLVKPMEGLNESGPPPFLKKLYEMVEDPGYNSIVSWSESDNSLIVWDQHLLSENLLPKFFKHKNFSSFIRQLNTYGFRKIDADRWEFANESFRRGEQHLLKGIKRRSKYTKQQPGEMSSAESTAVEAEVNDLKRDQNVLQQEILKLRQQQEESQHQMSAVEERIRFAEHRQLQMFSFFDKVVMYPNFVQQLIRRKKQQRELERSEFCKKRKLIGNQAMRTVNQIQKQLESMQPELTKFSPDGMEVEDSVMEKACSAPADDGLCSMMSGTDARDMSSVYTVMSQNLMGEVSAAENKNDEELAVNDSKIYLELEDLIGKPCGWGEYGANKLVEQSGCVGSIP